jgi:type IV pilus assembly protein PilC
LTHDQRIDAIEREFRAERMSSIRLRLLFAIYAVTRVVPEFKSIFNSMNVELPGVTKTVLAVSDIFQDWWFLVLPAAWIGWRLFEERFLRKGPMFRIRLAARLLLVALIGLAYALYMPMLKLINNVG